MIVDDDVDLPFGALPQRDRVRLSDARIEAAIAEVRVVPGRTEIDAEAAAGLMLRLAPFGVLHMDAAEQREVAFMVGPVGSPRSEIATTARGWQFFTPDRSCVFTLLPNVGSVQVSGGYDRWSTSLRPHLLVLLETMRDLCQAPLVQRLGLRYLNRMALAADDQGWLSVIDATVAGVLAHPVLGGAVRNAHQQFELALEPTVGAVVRHGPLATPGASDGYLIDLDVFDAATASLDPSTVVGRAQRLNRTAFALFTQMLTEEQLERMGPEQLEEPQEDLA